MSWLLTSRLGQLSSIPGGREGPLSPGRTDPFASRPARRRFAPPLRHAPPRPDLPVVCQGFEFDKSGISLNW